MANADVDSLLNAVMQLPTTQLQDFTVRFERWRREEQLSDDELIQATKQHLEDGEEQQLRDLIKKSESNSLTEEEWTQHRSLGQRAEQLNVSRIQALAELARQRGQPIQTIMEEVGWEPRHGA